jgi:ferrous iron transport protein A
MMRTRLSDIDQKEKGDAILRLEDNYGFQRNLSMHVISNGRICTLTDLKAEEQAKIVSIEGGRGIRRKLSLRAVSEGCIVRMISFHSPVTVEVDRNVVAMGKGMAQKIRVVRGD